MLACFIPFLPFFLTFPCFFYAPTSTPFSYPVLFEPSKHNPLFIFFWSKLSTDKEPSGWLFYVETRKHHRASCWSPHISPTPFFVGNRTSRWYVETIALKVFRSDRPSTALQAERTWTIVNVTKIVLCCGSIPTINGRVISLSIMTASPVKPTNGVETLLSWPVSSHIREKVE